MSFFWDSTDARVMSLAVAAIVLTLLNGSSRFPSYASRGIAIALHEDFASSKGSWQVSVMSWSVKYAVLCELAAGEVNTGE